jgi:hypothetical protein
VSQSSFCSSSWLHRDTISEGLEGKQADLFEEIGGWHGRRVGVPPAGVLLCGGSLGVCGSAAGREKGPMAPFCQGRCEALIEASAPAQCFFHARLHSDSDRTKRARSLTLCVCVCVGGCVCVRVRVCVLCLCMQTPLALPFSPL